MKLIQFKVLSGLDASFTTLHATTLQKTANHIRGRIFGVGMPLKSLGFCMVFQSLLQFWLWAFLVK
jgi:hypothetical protein